MMTPERKHPRRLAAAGGEDVHAKASILQESMDGNSRHVGLPMNPYAPAPEPPLVNGGGGGVVKAVI